MNVDRSISISITLISRCVMKIIVMLLLSLFSISTLAQSNELDSVIHSCNLDSLVLHVMRNNKRITKIEAQTRVIRAFDFAFKATATHIAVKKNCREKIYVHNMRKPDGSYVMVGGTDAFNIEILDMDTPGAVRILQVATKLPSKEWVDKKMTDILDGWIE